MIKLFIFESVEDAKAFASFEPVGDRSGDLELPKREAPYEPQPEKRTYTKKTYFGPTGSGRGHGVPHCKLCGKAGHRSNGCPTREDEPKQRPAISLSEDELHAAIQGLKEDGRNSVYIANKLNISLKRVNDHW